MPDMSAERLLKAIRRSHADWPSDLSAREKHRLLRESIRALAGPDEYDAMVRTGGRMAPIHRHRDQVRKTLGEQPYRDTVDRYDATFVLAAAARAMAEASGATDVVWPTSDRTRFKRRERVLRRILYASVAALLVGLAIGLPTGWLDEGPGGPVDPFPAAVYVLLSAGTFGTVFCAGTYLVFVLPLRPSRWTIVAPAWHRLYVVCVAALYPLFSWFLSLLGDHSEEFQGSPLLHVSAFAAYVTLLYGVGRLFASTGRERVTAEDGDRDTGQSCGGCFSGCLLGWCGSAMLFNCAFFLWQALDECVIAWWEWLISHFGG